MHFNLLFFILFIACLIQNNHRFDSSKRKTIDLCIPAAFEHRCIFCTDRIQEVFQAEKLKLQDELLRRRISTYKKKKSTYIKAACAAKRTLAHQDRTLATKSHFRSSNVLKSEKRSWSRITAEQPHKRLWLSFRSFERWRRLVKARTHENSKREK